MHKKNTIQVTGVLLLVIALGYIATFQNRDKFKADVITTLPDRSVKLNSYNSFGVVRTAEEVKLLAQRDRIILGEANWRNVGNIKTNPDYPNGFNAAIFKSINPKTKTYVYYPLDVKGAAEDDSWMERGATTSATTTTLTDSTKNWTTNAWLNRYVWIIDGTGKDQVKRIISNTATTLTLAITSTEPGFGTLPDSTSKFVIVASSTPQNPAVMRTPVSYADIEKNDWWFRDASGNIVYEGGSPTAYGGNRFLDVGAFGYKEAYLTTMLARLNGKGYDGVVFDYWWPNFISSRVVEFGYTVPTKYKVASGDANALWFQNAWQPFVQYVVNGLRSKGYKVVGNVAGEYNTPTPAQQWQRSILDGTIYEQWAVGWRGEWLSGDIITKRINAFRDDPLDTWAADYGLRSDNGDYSIAATYATDTVSSPKTVGQSFSLFYDNLKKFNIAFKRVGTRTDYNLTFSIYSTDTAGLPTGAPLAQVSEGSAFISQIGDKTNLDVDFGNVTVVNGKKYILEISQTGADASNYVAAWRSADRVISVNYLEYDQNTAVWTPNYIKDIAMTIWASGEQQRADLALAMYYIALPNTAVDPTMRTLNFAHNGQAFWQPAWDLNIGKPSSSYVKDATKYFWTRDFVSGKVILNYDVTSVQTTLSREYVDANGNIYSGLITVPAHTGLVLKTTSAVSPTISISNPANGTTVSGIVGITSVVNNSTDLQKVNYYLDDSTLIGSSSASPFATSWDSKTATNGNHKITAQALSSANLIITSSNGTVNVSNTATDIIAPLVSITAPSSNASVTKGSTQTITASASDNTGVTKVDFYINNTLVATDAAAPYSYSWKVPKGKSKTYALKVRAYDAAGNSSIATIQVTSQ